MNKIAFIVDINKNSGKNTKDNHLSTLSFVIYRHPVTLFTGTLIDTSWILIYFTILLAFYLFE